MAKEHHYSLQLHWTGNVGEGTSHYTGYSRNHEISATGKRMFPGSSDPAFRGDPSRYNPEELLVASLSSCHMLWYLHLCARDGVVVLHYTDSPTGTMQETAAGGGYFTKVTLHPRVQVAKPDTIEQAAKLHEEAHHLCFIANSVNFEVAHVVEVYV